MLVVADTNPLNYLVLIEAVEILPKLYRSIAVPAEVREELLVADAPTAVRAWAESPPDWVWVCSPSPALPDDPLLASLDAGERAAIALAARRQPSVLLIDERAGSLIARRMGLAVTGTLGVLDEAARQGLVSLPDAMARLRQTSFRYPKALIARLLEEDARR